MRNKKELLPVSTQIEHEKQKRAFASQYPNFSLPRSKHISEQIKTSAPRQKLQ
jgi:hypothetical protein